MTEPNRNPAIDWLTPTDLQDILDAIPAPLFVKDAQSRILLMNRQCEEQWGIEFARLAGKDGSEFFPADQMEVFLAGDRKVFEDGEPIEMDETVRNVWRNCNEDVHTTKKPTFDAQGRPRLLIGVSVDIQKRKLAEARLEVSENTLRNLYELSPLGISRNDVSGRFLEFNSAFEKICGFSRDELMRMDYWMLTPAEYADQEQKALELLAAEGHHYGPYEKEYIRKDGSRIPVRLNGVLVTEADGNQYIWSIIEDISQARKNEAQLAESGERFSYLVNAIPQMVWTATVAGKLTYVNSQLKQFLGISTDDMPLLERAMFKALSPAGRRTLKESWSEKGLVSQTEFNAEFQARRFDGEYRWLDMNAIPIKNPQGVVTRWIGTMTDITERRLIDTNLRESQKLEALGSLTGGLAHDFNNLLGIVLGNLDMLQAAALDPKSAARLQVALTAAERGAELTKSLLAVARGQSIKLVHTRLDGLLREMEPLLLHTVGARIKLVLRIDLQNAVAMVDRAALESSLLNLVINARDAMPQGGRLNILLRPPSRLEATEFPHGAYATLEVEDTGCGMTAEVARKATNPFFTTKERGRGTGLGLAMVNAFAHESGGHLRIQTKVGVGTSVQLSLPISSEPVPLPPSAASLAPARPAGMARVLVVDDEAPLLELLSGWLTDSGYSVRSCTSGDQAWSALQQETPDIMITDVIMPGTLDGLELAQKAHALLPNLRILLVSGFPIDGEKAVSEMRWPMLSKPYRREELLNTVARLQEKV